MFAKMTPSASILVLIAAASLAAQAPAPRQAANEALFEAARTGDVKGIDAALNRGADINATSRYDVTALMFAANNGRVDAVKLLVERGAHVNTRDTFYKEQAGGAALSQGHIEIAVFLLDHGWEGGDAVLIHGVQLGNTALVKTALGHRVTRSGLQGALAAAERLQRTAVIADLKTALDAAPGAASTPSFTIDAAVLPRFTGTYRAGTNGPTLTISLKDGVLFAQPQDQVAVPLTPAAPGVFQAADGRITLTFNERGGIEEEVVVAQGPGKSTFARIAAASPPIASAVSEPRTAAASTSPVSRGPRNWPSFRGEAGSGNGDGQRAVVEWDVTTGRNIKWKTPIPGLANSSPIVWNNRVFVTTAVSTTGDNRLRTGLYGDVAPVRDLSEHEWKIYALDKSTGKVVWERSAYTGTPKTKRHTKATQANSTPVTDGRRVVAVFGSIGLLVAWDFNGKELWRTDLGVVDSGWFLDPGYQWGHSSSPIIFRNSVIVQADGQKGSHLAAWDLTSGKQLWKTAREDEISTWGTPVVLTPASGRAEVVTNGTKVRGYDAASGKLLWTLGPNSEITVGSPVTGNGLVFVTGGYPPVRPIYAIRPGAAGDISLPKGSESSDAIAWSNMTDGTYIPTPLVYDGKLITLNINGIVNAYNASTGERVFRGRVGEGGAFAASPVAADGRLYIASEDGDVYVMRLEPGLTPLAKNGMNEIIMATPAISDGLIFIRTLGHVFGVGE
jgi:outer membrane protein assembly factor BamB